MASAEVPASLTQVLGLRPPLATSTRTDLAPSFKLLRSLVDTVFGSPSIRAPEPGLWRKQLQRAAERAGALVGAVWERFGGKQGVMVDDEGEGGRGVMKLQAVIGDLQMFAASIASQPDPLSSLLLDSAAFNRTSGTLASLTKKLAGLASHYEVVDALPSPPGGWPDEDAVDKAEDLNALPLLIAKSRPSREVLKRFEAQLPAEPLVDEPESFADQSPSTPSRPGSTSPNLTLTPSSPSRRASSSSPSLRSSTSPTSPTATTRRPDFLRFVFSQNPALIPSTTPSPTADESTLDAAVASASALIAANPAPATLSRAGSGPSSDAPRKSLIQQRIASFGSTLDSAPPLPKDFSRRAASEGVVGTPPNAPKRTWTIDESGAGSRRASGSWSATSSPSPSPAPGALPKLSVSGPNPSVAERRPSAPIRPPAVERKYSEASLSPPSSRSSAPDDGKGPGLASFAEQAAAIIAARKGRQVSGSVGSSSASSLSRRSLTPMASKAELSEVPKGDALPFHDASAPKKEQEALSDAAKVDATRASVPPAPISSEPTVKDPTPTTPVPPKADVPRRPSPSSITRVSIIDNPKPLDRVASTRSSVLSISPAPSRSPSKASSLRQPSFRSSVAPRPPSPTDPITDLGDDISILDAISAPDPAPAPKRESAETDETSKPDAASTPVLAGTDEPSLADLVSRASMFKSWEEGDKEKKPLVAVAAQIQLHSATPARSPRAREPTPEAKVSTSTGRGLPAEPSSPSASSWVTSLLSSPPMPNENLVGSPSLPTLEEGRSSGLRILSIDGGGVRGLSALFIVRALMDLVKVERRASVAPKPCEVFDMICGAGTGGIIALLLGRLRLDVESAIDAYLSIARDVFGQGKGAIAVLLGKTRYSASKLEAAMKDVVQSAALDPRASLADSDTSCRTFVLAMRTSEGAQGSSRTLRSYATRKVQADRCHVYQAARATSATPLFFKPIAVDDAHLASVPNNAQLNNPSSVALREMGELFPGASVATLVSVGAGRVSGGGDRVGKACAEISATCEAAAAHLARSWKGDGTYARLNVEQGLDGLIREWEAIGEIASATSTYVQRERRRLAETVHVLSAASSTVTPSTSFQSVQTPSPLSPPNIGSKKQNGVRPSLSLENLPGATFTLHDFPSTGSLRMPSFD